MAGVSTELEAARERAESERDARSNTAITSTLSLWPVTSPPSNRLCPPRRASPKHRPVPSVGVTPGCCGLLLPHEGRTILIAGDAVASEAHLLAGQILPCPDREMAQASFTESVEIADFIVCGRDGMIPSPAGFPNRPVQVILSHLCDVPEGW